MKTSIYIENGAVQLVITPETDFEKSAIDLLIPNRAGGDRLDVVAQVFRGSFYDCRGGWVRQSAYLPHATRPWEGGDKSLIIRTPTDKEHVEI